MGNYTLLQKRPTGYYYRQIVPLDIRPAVGKKEIIQSLKTKDKADALRFHKELAIHYSRYFDSIRSGEPALAPTVTHTNAVVEQAVLTPITLLTESNATTTGKGKTLHWLADEWIKQKASKEGQFKKAGLARRVVVAKQR